MDGFHQIMSFYQQQQEHEQLPDYLIIMDDDTYMNMNSLVDVLPRHYQQQNQAASSPSSFSSSIPALAIAGCRIRSRIYEHNMTIPFGGMGIILSRKTVENFATPLFCNHTSSTMPTTTTTSSPTTTSAIYSGDDFQRLACWRLAQNGAGERPLFRPGMTLVELMHAYTSAYPYVHADRWKQQADAGDGDGGVGYCMHSDWMWGYFINVYPVSRHTPDEIFFQNVLEDRLQGYNGSTIYAGRKSTESNSQLRQCRHKNAVDGADESKSCPLESHICHRLSERRMRELYQQQQRLLSLQLT
jgi:hypothetical protein